jgi:hypothetical protein
LPAEVLTKYIVAGRKNNYIKIFNVPATLKFRRNSLRCGCSLSVKCLLPKEKTEGPTPFTRSFRLVCYWYRKQ